MGRSVSGAKSAQVTSEAGEKNLCTGMTWSPRENGRSQAGCPARIEIGISPDNK